MAGRSNLKLLELFAGSRSVGKVAESMGWEVFSSDITPYPGINYVTDILDFDLTRVPFHPDVVWASPPCTTFSVASIGTHWDDGRQPKTEAAEIGLEILRRTLHIVRILSDLYGAIFFIENPRGMMRTMPEMEMVGIRHTVTYCQYDDTRMKPTDIWTNHLLWQPRPMCKNGDPCHEAAPRGSKTGTQGLGNAHERSKIPEALCREILESI